MLEMLPNRPSATVAAEQALRDAIVSGELAPGTKLPPERVLSKQLGVSRLTLRAALATLSASGLIAVRHGSGYTVRDVRETGGTDLLPGLIAVLADEAGATDRRETRTGGRTSRRGGRGAGGSRDLTADERAERGAVAADLLRLRRHLAAAVLEAIAERPPTAAARKAVGRAIERFADATALLHVARTTVAVGEKQRGVAIDVARTAAAGQHAARTSSRTPAFESSVASVGLHGAADGYDPARGFPGAARAAAESQLRAAELAIVDADLGVVRALLDATDSMILRVCLNPVIAVLRDSAVLRAAIYKQPETNLVGWRALGVWLERPDATTIPVLLGVLAQRDRDTVERLQTKRSR